MRHIALDTETTGLQPEAGHRIVEIGCVELLNFIPTGRTFHRYVNPERDVPLASFNVHGLSEDFLKEHAPFRTIAQDFLAFIEDVPLVIHNAQFDLKFLNHELQSCGHKALPFDRAIDTIYLARRKFPNAPASLDALCKRFGIDNAKRVKHGALLDAELLAEVYLQLMGGRQQGLALEAALFSQADETTHLREKKERPPRAASSLSEAEQTLHEAFLQKLNSPLWFKTTP